MKAISIGKRLYQGMLWSLVITTCSVTATELKFSEFEQQVFDIVMAEDLSAEQRKVALAGLQTMPASQAPVNQALLFMFQCRYVDVAALQEVQMLKQQFLLLREHPQYKDGAAAEFACQGYMAANAGSDEFFTHDFKAFHSLVDVDLPLLKMWLSYDYANSAVDYGYPDQSLMAIELSLNIAKANELNEWYGESLGVHALVQSYLGLHEEALSSNSQALALVTNPTSILQLKFNRGFIFNAAQRFEEALDIYNRIISEAENTNVQNYLLAANNISQIYFQKELVRQNLTLTEKMIAEAQQYGDGYLLAYTKISRALALLSAGEIADAPALFDEAKAWFKSNNVLKPLNENLSVWANELYRAGFEAEAFAALKEHNELRQSLEQSRRTRDAVLQNAMLETEQQRLALLQSQQAHQQDRALLLQKQLQQRLWLTVIVAATVISALVLFAYYRLRRAHELLAVKNQQLDYESSHDPLTKVFNRRYFNQFIASKLAAGNDALLLLMDIDFFKKVNDTHGHQAGDQVLQIVSKRLASRMRDSDCIVRWGGEEFLLYVDKPADITNCRALVQRLLAEVEGSPIKLDNAELNVTISIGFAYVQLSTQAELELQLAQIDTYLYQAKNQGRNRAVGLFSADTAAQVPLVITSELATA